MSRRHPRGTYLYVWGCDLVGLAIMVLAWWGLPSFEPAQWLSFAIWTVLLCVAHLGVMEFVGLNILSGWSIAIDFAAALVLPLPLFCLAVAVWYLMMIGKRLRQRHPEPFLGPDFNSANVLIAATIACEFYSVMMTTFEGHAYMATLALLPTAVVFSGMQTVLLASLLSIDLRRPWRKAGCLDADAILGDAMMVAVGAMLGRVYQLDPYLVVLMLVPVLLMHRTLARLSEAKLAYVDGKTGLHNYRFLDEALNDSIQKASQSRKPLAVIFGDMDHLRDINNTYGHLVGDLALCAVAKAYQSVAAGVPNAVAARFGGEEFILMAPGLDKAQAAEVAEQVRALVAEKTVPLETGTQLRLTISIGVAAFPEDARSVEELVKAADEAVYEAKNGGRNRVCTYQYRQLAL